MLTDASLNDDEDLRSFLLNSGDSTKGATPETPPEPIGRLRLYDDLNFLKEGYRFLSEQNTAQPAWIPIEDHGTGQLTITAPQDLKRRLGASTKKNDVIFGSTAIPEEAWPEHDQFRLTTSTTQVETAIKAARNRSGYWSGELLCTEQHPILQWVNERLLMLVPRGEAPIIASQHLEAGEMLFCFIGLLCSRSGNPLVVDAHAVSFGKGGKFKHRSLREGLAAAKFEGLMNAKFVPTSRLPRR